VFDDERLDACRLELKFISSVTPPLEEAKTQASVKNENEDERHF